MTGNSHSCLDCRFVHKVENMLIGWSECRFHPPSSPSLYPQVTAKDWCHQFRLRDDVVTIKAYPSLPRVSNPEGKSNETD